MAAPALQPVRLTGPAALRWGLRFARDSLATTVRVFEEFGPFVILADALPLIRPRRTVMLSVPLVLTAGAQFNAELLSDPAAWRGVSVLPGGPRGSAARRMNSGLTRLTSNRHAHYRKLVLIPLRRTNVEASAARMAQLADAEVDGWHTGTSIDLWGAIGRMMQRFSVEFLFGGDSEQSRAIAVLAGRMMTRKWEPAAIAFPLNLPFTPYGRIVRDSEELERAILQWVKGKRGRLDESDLASLIVNSPDPDGNPADDATIVAQIASLFALSSEGSQSVVTWTLFLLMQYPGVAATLLDELREKLGATSPALDRAGELPYLDAVVKESMRILPPVPIQIRVAQSETAIAGQPMPYGTRVMLNAFLTNRMPPIYSDGDLFRPERWLSIAPSAFEFPVFGAGPHLCPGFWFGTAAVKIALAAILSRYRLELAPSARIDYRTQPTLRPRQVLRALVQPADRTNRAAVPVTGNIRNLLRFSDR